MSAMPVPMQTPEAVSGVQLAQGIGVQAARGFWADAWAQVLRRRGAVAGLCWLGVVTFFAVFAPFLANGHPLVMHTSGVVSHPFARNIQAGDVVLVIGALVVVPWILYKREGRAPRLGASILGGAVCVLVLVGTSFAHQQMDKRDAWGIWRTLRTMEHPEYIVAPMVGLLALVIGVSVPAIGSWVRRVAVPVVAVTIAAASVVLTWDRPLSVFNYIDSETTGAATATYTIIPFSPAQRFTSADRRPPGSKLGESVGLPAASAPAGRRFYLGTDAFGQDVLTELLWACRLAVSIGLVSTGIAVTIGVTMGALMGYFGGWVDLLLYRVVEVFMAVPVLFLLIVAAAVLPEELRTTYTMMAIIGCFSWTGAARFTRAEFLKLRNQDFVQSARAVGLPLHSLLFKHMLPNGVTPVLVDASFSIAAAIAVEATLSYLGLGPVDQPSWGKLLASAMSAEGEFKWWLAVFPGAAIFLTILSYNLVGEALRDAIDPKLKKARV